MSSSSSSTRALISNSASITAFNRGPIPTQFSAPASCLSTLTSVDAGGGLYFGHNGESYLDPACYPTATLSSALAWDLYYYSPAVNCPSGWFTAATAKNSFGGLSSTYLTVGSATTVAVCCPSGYTAANLDHQCVSTFPIGTNTILFKNPSSGLNNNWVVPTTIDTTKYVAANPTGTSTTSYWTVFGDGIPIWYQAADLLSMPTKTSNPTTTTSPTTTSTTSTTSAASTGSSGLTTGAKAGIGIGVSLGVIAIAGLIGWFLFRRRRRYDTVNQRSSPIRELESIAPEKRNSELPAGEVFRPQVHELYSDDGVPAQHRAIDDNGPREVEG